MTMRVKQQFDVGSYEYFHSPRQKEQLTHHLGCIAHVRKTDTETSNIRKYFPAHKIKLFRIILFCTLTTHDHPFKYIRVVIFVVREIYSNM